MLGERRRDEEGHKDTKGTKTHEGRREKRVKRRRELKPTDCVGGALPADGKLR
jgi:hypothetical protein